MVEGTENKLTHIEHIMKAINLTKGFHISLSATTRHRLSAGYCTYSFFFFLFFFLFILIEYSQQISGFTLIKNLPMKSAAQAGNSFVAFVQKKKKKERTHTKKT